ncbi:MAG TPA: ABC transporter permease [Candidatus Desulfofervidus auxilii]|uniref:ABC transporter permease n=1 Tax=Desulfofervidus auxilii TaxID=1621989 RepID=A0A7C0U2H2_DESA2|nr:ABC transporter permease [Candidatus Desulfofervidus auxilii]
MGKFFIKLYLFLREIFASISFYRLRFFFSILSISLGVGTMALIIAATEGANKKAYKIFGIFGPDAILIIGGGEKKEIRQHTYTLTLDDVNAIKHHISGVYEVIPMVFVRSVLVKYKNKKWETRVLLGTIPDYFPSWKWSIIEGSAFTKEDVVFKRMVAVLGIKVKNELFGNNSPIGQTIIINGRPVKVIGVLAERGGATGRKHLDDRVVMPLTTVMDRFLNEDKYINLIRVRTHSDLKQTAENIRKLLRYLHQLGPVEEDDFQMFTAEEVWQFLKIFSGSLILFLGTAGFIALIVGGFILANLSYLAIRQRAKEIGIKRAYGAKKIHIAFSFLTEIIFTTLLGGGLGMIFAFIAGIILEKFGKIPMFFSLKVWLLALGLSLIIGLFSGLKPALKAAHLKPIEAIRG